MSARESNRETELLQLTVDIWHPNCWTLETTEGTDAGLLGYGTTRVPGTRARVGYYTAFGESREAVDEFVERIRASEYVGDAVQHALGPDIAPVSRTVIVDSGTSGGMREVFRSRGYLHLGPTYHRDGREQRVLLTRTERKSIRRELAEIESTHDADVDLVAIAPIDSSNAETPNRSGDATVPIRSADAAATTAFSHRLSVRQREAFVLARERGYYEYPRNVDTATLASELDIAETTFLEHLRKAERKLLTNVPIA